jgi:hypothetical protein
MEIFMGSRSASGAVLFRAAAQSGLVYSLPCRNACFANEQPEVQSTSSPNGSSTVRIWGFLSCKSAIEPSASSRIPT